MSGGNPVCVLFPRSREGGHHKSLGLERPDGIENGTDLAHSSIRFSVGRFNTMEEIEAVIHSVQKAVGKLRDMSPLYEMAKEGIDLKSVQWSPH